MSIQMTDVSPTTPVNTVPPPPVSTKPPLLIESTLHLAWGLTLFLSTSDKQSSLAGQIKDTLMSSFNTTSLGDTDKRYVNNLITVISSYLRSMGYEKDIYDRSLQTLKDELQRKTDYWKSMGDMTSFSGDSTLVKIASFFGIGVTGSTVKDILLPATKDSITIAHNATQSIPTVAEKVSVFSPEFAYPLIISGTVGLFATMIFLKWFGRMQIDKEETAINAEQDEYWQNVMRRRYKEKLKILYADILDLIKYYYPKFHDDPLIKIESEFGTGQNKNFDSIIDEILPTGDKMYNTTSLLKDYIEKFEDIAQETHGIHKENTHAGQASAEGMNNGFLGALHRNEQSPTGDMPKKPKTP